jgi:hypothetical protein
MSSFPLTNSIIFQRGRSTTNQIIIHDHPWSSIIILDQQFTSSTNQPDTSRYNRFGDVKEISHGTPNEPMDGAKPFCQAARPEAPQLWDRQNGGFNGMNYDELWWTWIYEGHLKKNSCRFQRCVKTKVGMIQADVFLFSRLKPPRLYIDNENIYYIINRNSTEVIQIKSTKTRLHIKVVDTTEG